MLGVYRYKKKAVNPLGLELRIIVTQHTEAQNQSQVLLQEQRVLLIMEPFHEPVLLLLLFLIFFYFGVCRCAVNAWMYDATFFIPARRATGIVSGPGRGG